MNDIPQNTGGYRKTIPDDRWQRMVALHDNKPAKPTIHPSGIDPVDLSNKHSGVTRELINALREGSRVFYRDFLRSLDGDIGKGIIDKGDEIVFQAPKNIAECPPPPGETTPVPHPRFNIKVALRAIGIPTQKLIEDPSALQIRVKKEDAQEALRKLAEKAAARNT